MIKAATGATVGVVTTTTTIPMSLKFARQQAGNPIAPLASPNQTPLNPSQKVNLFLTACLATIIFAIMCKVVHQKLMNMDTYRQFMFNSIGNIEKFALEAAQATMMKGQLQAQAQIAQATGMLVSGIIGIGLGAFMIMRTGTMTAKVNSEYNQRAEAIKEKFPAGPEREAQLNTNENSRQSALQTAFQNDKTYRIGQLLEQTGPQFAQSISQIIGAQYTIQASTAEASQSLFQAAMQADQSIVQDLTQSFQQQSADSAQIMQATEGIFRSETQQG